MKLSRNYVTPFVSLVFIVVGLSGLLMFFHLFDGYTEIAHEYLDTLLLERITKAPIGEVFTALQIDHREVTKKLAAKGISLQGATTVEDIWIKNNTSPEEVFDLILQ